MRTDKLEKYYVDLKITTKDIEGYFNKRFDIDVPEGCMHLAGSLAMIKALGEYDNIVKMKYVSSVRHQEKDCIHIMWKKSANIFLPTKETCYPINDSDSSNAIKQAIEIHTKKHKRCFIEKVYIGDT